MAERDYKAEYARRIAKGRAAGKTRQQARGHARGEGKAVRRRPTTKVERQEARERAATTKRYGTALKLGGSSRSGGIKTKPFQGSLLNRKAYPEVRDVYFVYYGTVIDISPKETDTKGKGRVTISRLFTVMRPPVPLRDVIADMDRWVEETREEASQYLEDPELERIWYNRNTGG